MTTYFVDQGMAWCTVAGGFIANFLLGGLAKSYGLIMESFQEEFQTGSAYLLFAGGLIYTLMYCLSLVNHYISQRYGSRPVVLAGAFGSCISLLVAAYSPNVALWVVAVGVGLGASLSCIYFTVFSVVGQCFRRYLGLANGISVAGVSVGQMAFPVLITYLRKVYGTRGGAVVISGICLHLFITAVLMPRYIVDPENPPPEKNRINGDTSSKKATKSRKYRRLRGCGRQKGNRRVEKEMELTPDTMLINKNDSMLDDLQKDYRDMERPPQSMGDIRENGDSANNLSNGFHSASMLSLSQRYELRLIRALLIVYILGKIFGDIGDVSVSFLAPSHGTQLGFDAVTVSRAISLSGAVDLVSRLGVGWLTDRPGCIGKRGILLASVWIIEGINSLGFAELAQFSPAGATDQPLEPTLAVRIGYYFCFAVHGVCSGTAMTQMVVVLCDWVGAARLPHSLAVTMVVLGVAISPGQFALGYLADTTGSFVWPLRVCAIILVLAGILLLMEFPVRWLHSHGHLGVAAPVQKLNGSTCAIVNPSKHLGDPHLTDHCWQVVDSDSEPEERPNMCLSTIGMMPTELQSLTHRTGASGDAEQLLGGETTECTNTDTFC